MPSVVLCTVHASAVAFTFGTMPMRLVLIFVLVLILIFVLILVLILFHPGRIVVRPKLVPFNCRSCLLSINGVGRSFYFPFLDHSNYILPLCLYRLEPLSQFTSSVPIHLR